MNKLTTSRRTLLKKAGQLALAASLPLNQINASDISKIQKSNKGSVNHSVCSWTYGFLTLAELCELVKGLGINTIDLVAPKDFTILKEYQVNCSMCYTAGKISLTQGWNDPSNHTWLIKDYLEAIPLIAQAGYKNLICFSGNRNGMDNQTGLQNCVKGLRQILPVAEKYGITIQMELFNSKIDHKDLAIITQQGYRAAMKSMNHRNYIIRQLCKPLWLQVIQVLLRKSSSLVAKPKKTKSAH